MGTQAPEGVQYWLDRGARLLLSAVDKAPLKLGGARGGSFLTDHYGADDVEAFMAAASTEHVASVGIACAAPSNRFFIVDIDVKRADGSRIEHSEADAWAAEILPTLLPPTYAERTSTGGEHHIVTMPDGYTWPASKLAIKFADGSGVDFFAHTVYCRVWPTKGIVRINDLDPVEVDAEDLDAMHAYIEHTRERPAPALVDLFTPQRRTDQTSDTAPFDEIDVVAEFIAAGWTESGRNSSEVRLRRPGKGKGRAPSAIYHVDTRNTKFFTTSTHFDTEGQRSPLAVVAGLRFNGDIEATGRAMRQEWGDRHPVEARAAKEAFRATQTADGPIPSPEDRASAFEAMCIDWATFWSGEAETETWLAKPVWPAHRGTVIHAKAGTGKSLLALFIAANLATGRPVFGVTQEPITVVYADYEMTTGDVMARLEDMGFDETSDLSKLRYLSLPALAKLDTREGGQTLLALCKHFGAAGVVIDTYGRAVAGEEDRADTTRAFYEHTGSMLKAESIALLRVDHSGHGGADAVNKGARGSSAKNDDVDVVWSLAEIEGGYELTAGKRRMKWVPDVVKLAKKDNGKDSLSFELMAGAVDSWPAGTKDLADTLDALGAPDDIAVRTARSLLKEHDKPATTATVAAAIRWRKERFMPKPTPAPVVEHDDDPASANYDPFE